MNRLSLKTIVINTVIACLAISFLTGCGIGGGPRPRNGYSPTVGNVPFPDPSNLGKHSYGPSLSEGSGIVYTERAGSIDIDHLRGAADVTKRAYDLSRSAMINGKKGFSLSPPFEYYSNKIRFTYPPDWETMPVDKKEKIATEISLQVGQIVGYNSTLYHEMLTWFGTRFLLIPEFYSAFSWEDVYSDLLGTTLAVKAVQDPLKTYNEAMTDLIDEQMNFLKAIPREDAIKVTASVEGKWYKRTLFLPSISRRNIDIGLDDGYVSPVRIPSVSETEPVAFPVPVLDAHKKYGIDVHYYITSGHRADRKMRKYAGIDRPIEPLNDYPAVMKQIRKEAIEKYHHNIEVDDPANIEISQSSP